MKRKDHLGRKEVQRRHDELRDVASFYDWHCQEQGKEALGFCFLWTQVFSKDPPLWFKLAIGWKLRPEGAPHNCYLAEFNPPHTKRGQQQRRVALRRLIAEYRKRGAKREDEASYSEASYSDPGTFYA